MLFANLVSHSSAVETLVRRVEGPPQMDMANLPGMPPPLGVIPDFVNHPSRGHQVVVVWSVLLGLAVIFVALRMYTRLRVTRSVGYDDYTSILALLFSVVLTVIDIRLVQLGLGVHLWDLPMRTFSPHFLYYAYIGAALYPFVMIFAKSSILLLYHRVFRPNQITIWAIYATLALVVSYNISITFVAFFSCTPRSKSWYFMMPGKCINVLAAGVAGSVINIFTDFVILLLPMPMVWRLRLPMRQKIAVIGIFATGALVCAISIIRLQAMLAAKEDPDITWGQVPNSITGAIECNIGIACGCMPCLKPLFNRWIPKLKSIASSGSKGNSSSKRNNNGGSSSGGGVQEISARFSHSKKDKTPLSTTYSSNGDIDPRFASGKYLELGEMGTHQTVIGGPPGRSLYPQGSRGPMVSPTPPEAAMVANGRGIVKTVGVDVFAHEKGR